ncbi:MAG: hypothetical protein ACR2PH_10430 [Desulfobulbia bacterium]
MRSLPSQTNTGTDSDFTKTWRYKLGFTMIVVGNLGMLFSIFVLPFFGTGASIIGGLVVGGEVVSLASIVFLGKEGFKAIKNKIVGAAKSTYTEPVGNMRHGIGITLLLTNVVTTYVMMLYAWDAFEMITIAGGDAAVWGLDTVQQGNLVFSLFLVGEFSFLIAIYVLGADWWGRFRRIFVRELSAD